MSCASAADVNMTDAGNLEADDGADDSLTDSYDDPLDYLDDEIQNASSGDTIYLDMDYYCSDSSREMEIGIFTDNITIDGQGYSFDGNDSSISKLFTVHGNNVTFKSIKFVNWDLWEDFDFIVWKGTGGAMINCTFMDNTANSFDIIDWSGNEGTMESCMFINNIEFGEGSESSVVNWNGDYGVIKDSYFADSNANEGSVVLLNGVEGLVHNCTFSNNNAKRGGAIRWQCNDGTVNSSTFINCTSELGGAIYCSGSRLNITNSTFEENYAEEIGGAVYCEVDANVVSCRFIDNYAEFGGGIYSSENSYLVVEDTLFMDNGADSGGAVFSEFGIDLLDSKFINNYVNETGGALYLGYDSFITGSVFSNNSALSNESFGGAVFCDGYLVIEASNFTDNHANTGGALYLIEGEIANSTFAKNSAVSGGAIFVDESLFVNGSSFKDNSAVDGSNNIMAVSNQVDFDNTTSDSPLVLRFVEVVIVSANVPYGDDVKLKVTLITSDDEKLNGGTVSTTVNGKVYSAAVKDNTAVIAIPNLNVGSYSASVTYKSDEYAGMDYCGFSVLKDTPTIVAENGNYVINYGGKYSITLKNSNGNPISNQKVSFTFNGKDLGSATTNSKGVATIKLTAKLVKNAKAGKKNMIIKCGDANCNAVSKTVKINVNKEKTKISAKKKTFKKSKKVKKYVVKLKNSKGKAIKKAKLTLKVNGKTYKAKTNKKGKATFKINKLNKNGRFKAKIKFKSNGYYKATAKKVKITVKG